MSLYYDLPRTRLLHLAPTYVIHDGRIGLLYHTSKWTSTIVSLRPLYCTMMCHIVMSLRRSYLCIRIRICPLLYSFILNTYLALYTVVMCKLTYLIYIYYIYYWFITTALEWLLWIWIVLRCNYMKYRLSIFVFKSRILTSNTFP